jgi:hypothetical protein
MRPERWQKIEEIYHAALERDANLRVDYLRQEVESLLAQDSRAQFLESPPAQAAGKILADQQRRSSLVGQQLGSYKIISSLGAGGMAKSTRPWTRASNAPSPSRSSPLISLGAPNPGSASSAKRRRLPA